MNVLERKKAKIPEFHSFLRDVEKLTFLKKYDYGNLVKVQAV